MGVKVGDKIRIIHLTGEDSRYDGREGTVEYIDAIGQLHGTWGGLAVIPEEDEFKNWREGKSFVSPLVHKLIYITGFCLRRISIRLKFRYEELTSCSPSNSQRPAYFAHWVRYQL